MASLIVEKCPHCLQYITVDPREINCGVFRHGVYRSNFQQMDPHAQKKICDDLYANNQIYGCGRPLRFVQATGKFDVCDYI